MPRKERRLLGEEPVLVTALATRSLAPSAAGRLLDALSITEDKLASEVCAQKMKVEIVNHALQVELESMEEMMEDMSEISLRACKSSNALVQSLESENEELREQLRVMTEERDRLRRYTAEDETRLEKLESIYGPFGDEWYVSSSDDEGVLV